MQFLPRTGCALWIVIAACQLHAAVPTPAEQQRSFKVPAGFVVELVASEPDVPKPITVVWDDSGRMWTMTAVEYPVDGNESAAQAESLYKNPGRDRVLIFDPPKPDAAADRVLGKPRVFADGLAIPLGLLPYRDGAFVHHGSDIVLLRDTDGDGRSERREVILSGFGVQDSHLMPHQFTYAPGGWIYVAQGAFNYSQVRTRDGVVIRYDQTKLARFRPDGSAFEILTHGPCNIWGLVISRFGETWIQEANDYGYSMMRFEPGANYPGCGDTKFRPYAPMQPSIAEFRLGGTGLSGLALCEDENGYPTEWRDVMFVANPITRQVQAVRITRENGRDRFEKLPDFMTTPDEMFRPIAVHFGPDGCLYVVDWYNKIISHNEVPRNHPDRDKSHGRIWRVRHESQKFAPVPNVAAAGGEALLTHLASGNKWEWNAALHQIAERRPESIKASLESMARTARDAARQIRALWALESLQAVSPELLASLVSAPDANLRREVVRVAGTQLSPAQALSIARRVADDPDHFVRAEVIRVAAQQDAPWKHHIISGAEKRPDPRLNDDAVALLLRFAQPALPNANKPGPGYEREFERYLVRAALERHIPEVQAFLASDAANTLPAEKRRLACAVLPAAEAARALARIHRASGFAPSDEEWLVLQRHRSEREVAATLAGIPNSSVHSLNAALKRRELVDATADAAWLADSIQAVLTNESASAIETAKALEAARTWKVSRVADAASDVLRSTSAPELQLAALRALREFQSGPPDVLFRFATNSAVPVAARTEAAAALAVHRDSAAQNLALSLWPTLGGSQRSALVDQLSSSRAGSETLFAALRGGSLERTELNVPTLEKMRTVLASNAEMQALWNEVAASMKRVLRLQGGKDDYVSTKLTLAGPFTVEAWVRLDADISNLDGILSGPGMNPSSLDINFAGGLFRVWVGSGEGDIVIAKRKTLPDVWNHYAVTRNANGEFRIYINGELEATSRRRSANTYSALDLGRTIPTVGGTAGQITEFRVWRSARSASEILASFDRSFAGEELPRDLLHYFPAEAITNATASPLALVKPTALRGRARVEGTLDAPPLLTASEAKDLAQRFERFSVLAERQGDVARGQQVFETACLVCHQAGGRGAGFAPNLDGSAHRGTENLLRAMLTPSAAMEAGYRKFRVETTDGELHEGFLAQQDATGVILRQPNSEPLKIPAATIKRAGYQNASLMPEGLLEGLDDRSVSDLFSYLRTLK
jgi:putative membrane-bound dehydrogenase-like protein